MKFDENDIDDFSMTIRAFEDLATEGVMLKHAVFENTTGTIFMVSAEDDIMHVEVLPSPPPEKSLGEELDLNKSKVVGYSDLGVAPQEHDAGWPPQES